MGVILVDMFTTLVQLMIASFFSGRYIQTKNLSRFMVIYTSIALVIYILTGYTIEFAGYLRTVLMYIFIFTMLLSMRSIPAVPVTIFILISTVLLFLFEIPNLLLVRLFHPGFVTLWDLSPAELLIWRILCLPDYVFSYAAPGWLCNRIFRFRTDRDITKYLPFLIVQAFMMIAPTWMALLYLGELTAALLCTVNLAANIFLDYLLARTFRRINRTHELELQKEQADNLLQAQIDHYNQLQDNIQAVRQVRHDMKNQLQTLSILLDEGNLPAARQQLSEYREQMTSIEAGRFTGNTVLDAVISAKVDLCRQKDIPITCSGSIPEDAIVDSVHLCSIGANLLDNAIHACEVLPHAILPKIEFSAQMKEGKLVFRCKNPANPEKPLKPTHPELSREHGWGLTILSRIAQEYSGEFLMQETDGTVNATLWLLPQNSQ